MAAHSICLIFYAFLAFSVAARYAKRVDRFHVLAHVARAYLRAYVRSYPALTSLRILRISSRNAAFASSSSTGVVQTSAFHTIRWSADSAWMYSKSCIVSGLGLGSDLKTRDALEPRMAKMCA